MASTDRAILFKTGIEGVDSAVDGFKRVGAAGEQAITAIQKAAAAQAAHESALVKADQAAVAFTAAQGAMTRELLAAKAALKAGQLGEADYQAAVLKSKNALELLRAEYRGARTELVAAAQGVVQSRVAANDLSPALERVGKSTGNARLAQLEWQHVMRATTGAVLAGVSPLQALTLESGRIVEAMQLSSGGASKFATFMGGPWGIALGLGAGAAIQLALSMLKGRDAVGSAVEELRKHAEKTHTDELAQQRFANTIEGVTQAVEANRKAIEALNLVQDTAAEKALKAAAAAEVHALKVREDTVAELERAKKAQEILLTNAGGGVEGAASQGPAMLAVQREIDRLTPQLDAARAELDQQRAQLAEARTKVVAEQASASKEDQIKKRYDAQIDAAAHATAALQNSAAVFAMTERGKQRYIEQTNGALARQVRQIEAARQASLKALQDENHHVSNAQTGREVTPDQAAAIARSAGLQVNSVSRTYGQQKTLYDAWVAAGRPKDNPVAAPGTSAHEGAKGRWALDIQLAQGVTPELLRKVFSAQGIQLSKVFLERGHYHVEGSRSQADSAAEATDRAAQAEMVERQDYQNRLATLMSDELAARRALVTNPEIMAQLQRDEIEVQRKKYDDALVSLVKEGKLQDGHRKELTKLNDETARLRLLLVDRQEQERKLTEQHAAEQRAADMRIAELGNEEQLLHGQEELARTQAQRRGIEHRLLELQFEQEKIQNDLVIAYAKELEQLNLFRRMAGQEGVDPERLRGAEAAAGEAQLRNSSLQARQAQATELSDRKTADPLTSYLDAIPSNAAEINERVQGYVADELESVRKGIDDAISSAIGIKDPLLKGIIDLFVQEAIIRPIGAALQSQSGGGLGGLGGLGGSGGGGGDGLGNLVSALGSWFGGNGATQGFETLDAAMTAAGGGFASGTPSVPTDRPFWVGENGRELMRYHAHGRLEVMSNPQSHRFLSEERGGGVTIIQHNYIPKGADPRLTASGIARSTQGAIARAARKGLAQHGGR